MSMPRSLSVVALSVGLCAEASPSDAQVEITPNFATPFLTENLNTGEGSFVDGDAVDNRNVNISPFEAVSFGDGLISLTGDSRYQARFTIDNQTNIVGDDPYVFAVWDFAINTLSGSPTYSVEIYASAGTKFTTPTPDDVYTESFSGSPAIKP